MKAYARSASGPEGPSREAVRRGCVDTMTFYQVDAAMSEQP